MTTKMTKRNDTYLPVPGDEKTPDVEFVKPKAKSNESIVRNCVFLLAIGLFNTARRINKKPKMLEFCAKKEITECTETF